MSLDLVYFTGGARERVLGAILTAGHRVTHVYANDPARWPKVQPSVDLARSAGIPTTIIPNKAAMPSIINDIRDKVCLSLGFNYLFAPEFLAAARACLNVHGSLLPHYKGARTLAWAIEQGETQSGVTVHMVDAGMDTGPVILQTAFPLSPFETTRSLARKTSDLEPQVVVSALALFAQHGSACARPQAPTDVRDWPNRLPQHSELDPEKPLTQIFDKIRAADAEHYPAYFYHRGEKVCVKIWRPDRPADEADMV